MTSFRLTAMVAVIAVLAATGAAAQLQTPRFYPDDPLRAEPAPLPVADLEARALSEILERASNTFKTTGQRHPAKGVIPAGGVNTLDEVMDGDWYVNRHGTRRMTPEELRRGAGDANGPDASMPWRVLVVRAYGVNPGLLIADAKNDLYLLRFDPLDYEGLATGAEMVSSRFLHALGYHVAESYLVRFPRTRLVVHPEGQAVSSAGRTRALHPTDVDALLRRAPLGAGDMYRAAAIRLPDARQSLLGPFQMWGTRSDDPNDTVLHEHRRELRGLFVFAAWLNHNEINALTTQDVLRTLDGVQRIRHYLVDFTKSLGSGALGGPKQVWEGHETYVPDLGTAGRNVKSFGVQTPGWMKAKYPGLPEVGAFEGQTFDPAAWTSSQPLPPFENRLPDDTFWAAKQVMAFTDEDIRAIVETGGYTAAAAQWITAALIERRNRIGRTFFARVLPLDRFRLDGGALEFDDLGVVHGFAIPRSYTIDWHRFDNANDSVLDRIGTGAGVPSGVAAIAVGGYAAARVSAGDPALNVTVFLRRDAAGLEIVGLDRAWPGKVTAPPIAPARSNRRVFVDLTPRQQELFATYNTRYNETRGSKYSPEEGFNRLTVSEQSTFYAVTHALAGTTLTDASGAPLGTVLDRVDSVERIAGQYAGRGGDQQFRLYVHLKPDARDLLDKSQQFFRDHENTVYHVGYPQSYRQVGKEPSLQMSLAEDGLQADIDVDYRSSRSPQSLFNGHLTAANSDVRVTDNTKLHQGRWGGFIAWWQDAFGNLGEGNTAPRDIVDFDRPDAAATPLPADRPAGANPERLEDAVQEFLTDWLVRRQYQQALDFLSPRAYACLSVSDERRSVALDAAGARRELLTLMEHATKKLGRRPNLTSAMIAFVPRDPKRVVVDHAFKQDFLLTPLTAAEARPYLCDRTSAPAAAEYAGAVFQFRGTGGGALGLLWTREQARWKLVSFQPLAP